MLKLFRKTKEENVRCPECGGEPYYDLTCHTWKQGDRWMSCLPCDSAYEYSCYNPECDWGYTHGLNSRNPRWEKEQENRPVWLPEEPTYTNGFQNAPKSVEYYDSDKDYEMED